MAKKILVLTGGGPPDFSRAIAGLVSYADSRGYGVDAAIAGWKAFAEMHKDTNAQGKWIRPVPADPETIARVLRTRSSCIRVSRTKLDNAQTDFTREFTKRYAGLVTMGGEDTNSVTVHIPNGVGWPKTMDNNLGPDSQETDLSPGPYFDIGFPTFVEFAAKQTLGSLHGAYANGWVSINVYFGRNQDWVSLIAAAYGCAGVFAGCEAPTDFESFYKRIEEDMKRNREKTGVAFSNVAMAEGAWLEGYEEFAPKGLLGYLNDREWVERDGFGHPKIKPDILGQLVCDALKKRSGGKIKARPKVITYHGRDERANALDQEMSRMLSRKCVDMIDEGNFGRMATVRREGDSWVTGEIPIKDAIKERYVKNCGFLYDYKGNEFKPGLFAYAGRILGKAPKPEEELLIL